MKSQLVLRKGRPELLDERVITALAVCPSHAEAVQALKEQGLTATEGVLKDIELNNAERLLERKQELAPRMEAELNTALLDESRRSTTIIALALEKAYEKLENGQVADPARMARDISQIRSQGLDKKLALEGRPTQIVEKRDFDETLKQLQSMKVVEVIEATSEPV